jgi:uncharacterized protein DUF732
MAAQKRNRRFMGVAAIGGPLLLAGVFWAGPAQADATSYLNDLHNVGIGDDQGGDAALLQMGQKVCVQVGYGATTEQLVGLALQRSDADQGTRGLNPQQANDLINYAIADLCPTI